MDSTAERHVEQAVSDALSVGLTAFDKLPPELESVARTRYSQRVAERAAESGGHAQAVDPAQRDS